MADAMLQFVRRDRETPEKRTASDRGEDFDEIYREYAREKATEQASRCSQCGVPFCQAHCPLHNNIPDWLMLTANGRLQEAYETSAATNTFPEICGRICPQDRLCEGNCVIEQSGHGTVTIGAIEKYITETAFDEGWVQPTKPVKERPQSVGVVGAGPGGLAAAERLRRLGYQVTVYDRYDRPGGLLIYGIPGFKLEKEAVERRTRLLADSGIVFKMNFEVGVDATLEALRSKHDAIVLAIGVYKARDLQAPGVGAQGVVPALDYLTASNRKGLGDAVPDFDSGALNADGKRVVVIGGGDTAMDCVRTAVRQGAESVTCLYRRNKANMPGSAREVANAEEEGVTFQWLAQPEAFSGGDRVSGVVARRMQLGAPDPSGRQGVEPIADGKFTLDADLVVKALGFDAEDPPQSLGAPDLATTRWGTVRIDPKTRMTNLDGVFAVGDVVRGASLVVWAIKDGRDAADHAHGYIQGRAGASSAPAAKRAAA